MSGDRDSNYITDNDDMNESLMIHDIARLFKTDFDRRVRELRLTRSQWLALVILRRNNGISQSELADKLDVEPMTIVRTLERLEKAEWIERRRDAADRRIKRIYLTPRVQDVVVRMRSLGMEMRRDTLLGIDEQEHQLLVTLLKRIKHNLCKKT
jgi:MarR family transcriptional regulator, transcriptional regulator for hemolysin